MGWWFFHAHPGRLHCAELKHGAKQCLGTKADGSQCGIQFHKALTHLTFGSKRGWQVRTIGETAANARLVMSILDDSRFASGAAITAAVFCLNMAQLSTVYLTKESRRFMIFTDKLYKLVLIMPCPPKKYDGKSFQLFSNMTGSC